MWVEATCAGSRLDPRRHCMFLFDLLGAFDLLHGKNMFQETANSVSLGHRMNAHKADLSPNCSRVPSLVRPTI